MKSSSRSHSLAFLIQKVTLAVDEELPQAITEIRSSAFDFNRQLELFDVNPQDLQGILHILLQDDLSLLFDSLLFHGFDLEEERLRSHF